MKDSLNDIKQVFESPDGGKTVYARNIGDDFSKRRLIHKDDRDWRDYINSINWDDLAKEYPAVKDKLDELKIIETLCKK